MTTNYIITYITRGLIFWSNIRCVYTLYILVHTQTEQCNKRHVSYQQREKVWNIFLPYLTSQTSIVIWYKVPTSLSLTFTAFEYCFYSARGLLYTNTWVCFSMSQAIACRFSKHWKSKTYVMHVKHVSYTFSMGVFNFLNFSSSFTAFKNLELHQRWTKQSIYITRVFKLICLNEFLPWVYI